MPNYQNSKIYRLTCNDPELFYYGATTKKYLCHRLSNHKMNWINGDKIQSKLLFEAGDVRIELVEKYPCESKDELNSRESYYVRNYPCVNTRIEDRDVKEWRKDNAESLKQKQRVYQEKNKEKIEDYQKQYREKNKEKHKEYCREYHIKNKEKYNEKMICECGVTLLKRGMNRHLKTAKHKKWLEKNKE